MRTGRRSVAVIAGLLAVAILVSCSDSSDGGAAESATVTPGTATAAPTVSATAASSPAATAEPTVTPSGVVIPGNGERGVTAIVAAETLDVFAWPSSESYRIGTLSRGDTITVSHRWSGSPVWLALPGVGWVVASEGALQLDRPVTSIPQNYDRVAGPGQPEGAQTGVATIDSTIAVVLAADADEVDALLVYQSQACAVAPNGPGLVTCPEGVADGTVIDVFVRSVYEADASPIARTAGERTVDQFVTLDPADPPRLYAVVARIDVTILDSQFPIVSTAIFSRPGGSFGLMLDESGRIVAAVTAGPYATELFWFITSEGAEIVLPPAVPEGAVRLR